MPRRRVEKDPAANGSQAVDEHSKRERDDLEDLLEQLGGEAIYLRLYRRSGGFNSYLGQVGRDVDLEWIRQTYGGGDFTLQGVNNQGHVMARRLIKIDGPPKLSTSLENQPGAGRVVSYAPAAPEPPGSVYEAVRRLDDILHELRRPPAAAAQGNPLEMAGSIVTSILTAAAPILELYRDRPRPKSEGGAERLMEAFTRGMKIGVSMGRNGQAATWQDRLVDAVMPALKAGTENPAAGALPLAELGAESAPSVEPGNWRAAMGPYVLQFNRLAAAGKDPQLYGDLVYDQAPPEALDVIVQQVQRGEGFYREFFEAFPAAAPYREWWTELLSRIWEVATHRGEGGELGSDGAKHDVSGHSAPAAGG